MEHLCVKCGKERITLGEWNKLNRSRKLQRANLCCQSCSSNQRWERDKIKTPLKTPCVKCGELRRPPKNWTDLSLNYRKKWLRGSCRSCSKKTHGESHTRLYAEWSRIKERTGLMKSSNPIIQEKYINKGIKLCKIWRTFENFRDWALINGYSDELVIDRVKNNKGYSPNNCRWVSKKESSRNRTCVVLDLNEASIIFQRHKDGEKISNIAKDYSNLTYHSIWNVCRGKTWQEVTT